jgi:hypothetical protein
LPPLHSDGRVPDQIFEPQELLYRRVWPPHVISDNELNPAAVSFRDDDPSVVRSKYGSPSDALHADCAENQDVGSFDVYAVAASAVELSSICPNTRRVFAFKPVHAPLPACYAHSLISCREPSQSSDQHVEPTRPVRNDFRAKFAAAMIRCDMSTVANDKDEVIPTPTAVGEPLTMKANAAPQSASFWERLSRIFRKR